MSNVNRIDTTDVLSRTLDALALRQRVTANNVANVDTPGFKGSEVRFEEVLQRALGTQSSGAQLAMARTDAGHLMAGGVTGLDLQPRVVELNNLTLRNDGNNVDIEREMAALAQTQLEYNALTEAISRRMAMHAMVARDGR